MRKSTLFISAALTTFMLAIMFGVASAYQKIVQNGGTVTPAPQAAGNDSAAVNTAFVNGITPEQAAEVASTVLGRTDLYAAESSQLNGMDAYLVTFSSGDLVYVSLDGKVLSISKIPVKYVAGQPVWVGSGGNGGGDSSSVSAAPSSSSSQTQSNDDQSNEDQKDEDDKKEDEHDD